MKKKALITGVTGQDGSYLAELLLKKNYEVHGIIRKSSSFNTARIEQIYQGPTAKYKNFILHYGDLSETSNIDSVIADIMPDEIYNLAAQSHVAVSFKIPEYTSNINALGTLRILETIRKHSNKKKIKFYQASTSELYGDTNSKLQNENTPFAPNSPYASAKLFAYWITRNYRDSYGVFASNGILFNHESPRRGETFVTRKVTSTLSKIYYGLENKLILGNLDSIRDWGHAKDYAEMQWKILQHSKPDDFVVSTSKKCNVRDFIKKVTLKMGFEIAWKGKGLKEFGSVKKIINKDENCKIKKDQKIIIISKKYFRPNDVNYLRGDSSKARKILNWKPKYSLQGLIDEMVDSDMRTAQEQYSLKDFNEKNR